MACCSAANFDIVVNIVVPTSGSLLRKGAGLELGIDWLMAVLRLMSWRHFKLKQHLVSSAVGSTLIGWPAPASLETVILYSRDDFHSLILHPLWAIS